MSARLKLKKLKKEMEFMYIHCSMREQEARHEKLRYHRLLKENIQEIRAFVKLYPCEIMQDAIRHFNATVNQAARAVVDKYTEQLVEYVHNQLVTKYALTAFSEFTVTFFAPALNTDHIKVDVRNTNDPLTIT